MTVQPYLFFDGKCEEALEFYKKAIGAKVERLMRFSENPDKPDLSHMNLPAGSENKVMHAAFTVGGSQILVSDGHCAGKPSFQGFGLTLGAKSDAEAETLFTAVSEGGQVMMPLGKTFYASKFGMVTDRFGTPWMINVEKAV